MCAFCLYDKIRPYTVFVLTSPISLRMLLSHIQYVYVLFLSCSFILYFSVTCAACFIHFWHVSCLHGIYVYLACSSSAHVKDNMFPVLQHDGSEYSMFPLHLPACIHVYSSVISLEMDPAYRYIYPRLLLSRSVKVRIINGLSRIKDTLISCCCVKKIPGGEY
jgi:hypothetical protein